jgi:hypothetical protein
MKNIIILSEARTGSNLLCEIFFSYNSVRVLNELFINFVNEQDTPHYKLMSTFERNLFFKYFSIEDKTITGLIHFLNNNPKISLELFDKLYTKYKLVKVHNFIFEKIRLEFLLDDPETKFILLNRTSKIKQYVSDQVARQLQEWHSIDTSNVKIKIDANDFLKFKQESIEWYTKIESMLVEKNHNFLRINYEEDLENIDQEQLSLKINSWLDLNGIPSHNNDYKLHIFKKQNLTNLEQIITNYQEIQHLF